MTNKKKLKEELLSQVLREEDEFRKKLQTEFSSKSVKNSASSNSKPSSSPSPSPTPQISVIPNPSTIPNKNSLKDSTTAKSTVPSNAKQTTTTTPAQSASTTPNKNSLKEPETKTELFSEDDDFELPPTYEPGKPEKMDADLMLQVLNEEKQHRSQEASRKAKEAEFQKIAEKRRQAEEERKVEREKREKEKKQEEEEMKKKRAAEIASILPSVKMDEARKHLQDFQKSKSGTKLTGGVGITNESTTSTSAPSTTTTTTTSSTSASPPSSPSASKTRMKLKGKTICDYLTPKGPKELMYLKDSEVIVLKQADNGWWLAELNGRKGWIAAKHVKLS